MRTILAVLVVLACALAHGQDVAPVLTTSDVGSGATTDESAGGVTHARSQRDAEAAMADAHGSDPANLVEWQQAKADCGPAPSPSSLQADAGATCRSWLIFAWSEKGPERCGYAYVDRSAHAASGNSRESTGNDPGAGGAAAEEGAAAAPAVTQETEPTIRKHLTVARGRNGFDGDARASGAGRAWLSLVNPSQHHNSQRQRSARAADRGLAAIPAAVAFDPAADVRSLWVGGGGSPDHGAPFVLRDITSKHPAARLADKPVVPIVPRSSDARSTRAVSTTPPALSMTLYVGGAVTFGSAAEAGTSPFAQLRTQTRLTQHPHAPLLVTRTELTAAPGEQFDITDAGTFRALNFEAGVQWGPASWYFDIYAGCGVLARAFEADGARPPAQSRCAAGVSISGSSTSHLTLTYGYDRRGGSGRAFQLEASVDVGHDIALVGSLLAHGSNVTATVAACKAWDSRGGN